MKKLILSAAVFAIFNSVIAQKSQTPQTTKPQAEVSQKRNKPAQTPEQRAKKKVTENFTATWM